MASFLSSLKISLWVATSSTLLVAVFGMALAFILARCDFRGKNIIDAVVTIPMVLPPTVVGYCLGVLLGREGIIGAPLYRLTGWSFIFTWQGAVIAAFIVSLPLMVRVARSAFESVDEDLIRISYSLGKSKWETFVHVILPLARGGIMAGVLLAFARGLGEFGATMMIAGNIPGKTSTLSLSLYSAFQAGDDARAGQLTWVLTGISVFVIYLSGKLSRGRWM